MLLRQCWAASKVHILLNKNFTTLRNGGICVFPVGICAFPVGICVFPIEIYVFPVGICWNLRIPLISVDYCCCFFEITERFVKKSHLLRLKTFVDNSKSRSTSKKRVWYYSLFHWDCWRMKLFLKGKGFIRYVDSINLWWNSVTSYN